MSVTAATSKPPIQQESGTESEDDSDTDFDPEEIEKEIMGVKSMLRRQCAKHKNVAMLKDEHEHWLKGVLSDSKDALNLEGADLQETIYLVNKAEEGERARRMSMPFSADVEETELDISVQSGQLSNVHQELLHLFAIHDAKFQMDCELERRNLEASKIRMHEQLMSNMARRKASEEFERERERKLKEMKMLTETVSAEGLAMAETNDRLNYVHADLKNAFRRMRDVKAAKEEQEREKAEDMKEMMLQEIRRRPQENQIELIEEEERMRRMELYQQQMNDRRGSTTDTLLEVQEQLLKIFSKIKREKKIKKAEIQQQQEDHKNRMQEELLRKSNQKVVSIEEAHEKSRRITETKSQIADGDEAKAKAIDMLIDVQKQLLDVFAITKVQDLRERMNHLKVLNCRKNMLREIRSKKVESKRIDRENSSGFIRTPHASVALKSGKRLSLIGERLQLDTSRSPSQETPQE